MNKWLMRLYYKIPIIRELNRIHNRFDAFPGHQRIIQTSAVIQAIEALKAGNERYRNPKRLLTHGAQYFSQNYEDGMIAEIFRRISTTNKTFLEIGVGDGTENNTAVLLATGWRGFWLEGDSASCQAIECRLKKIPDTAARIKLRQAILRPDNAAALLADLEVPKEIDLFSLDIDLNTYHVWAALPDFRPRVVVVEYNAAIPPTEPWVHPLHTDKLWDLTKAFGASLKSFELLGREFGYSLVGCDITGNNAFFIRNDLLSDHFSDPFTAENHYEPPRYGLCFHHGHNSIILPVKN